MKGNFTDIHTRSVVFRPGEPVYESDLNSLPFLLRQAFVGNDLFVHPDQKWKDSETIKIYDQNYIAILDAIIDERENKSETPEKIYVYESDYKAGDYHVNFVASSRVPKKLNNAKWAGEKRRAIAVLNSNTNLDPALLRFEACVANKKIKIKFSRSNASVIVQLRVDDKIKINNERFVVLTSDAKALVGKHLEPESKGVSIGPCGLVTQKNEQYLLSYDGDFDDAGDPFKKVDALYTFRVWDDVQDENTNQPNTYEFKLPTSNGKNTELTFAFWSESNASYKDLIVNGDYWTYSDKIRNGVKIAIQGSRSAVCHISTAKATTSQGSRGNGNEGKSGSVFKTHDEQLVEANSTTTQIESLATKRWIASIDPDELAELTRDDLIAQIKEDSDEKEYTKEELEADVDWILANRENLPSQHSLSRSTV